jgi:hypothetical protein
MESRKRKRQAVIEYFSQNSDACGDAVDKACGAVSLANSLKYRALEGKDTTPKEIIYRASRPPAGPLRDRPGLSPDELCALATAVGQTHGMTAMLSQPCKVSDLAAGDLMYVGSIPLKNAQGGNEYEDAEFDSHIVMVESMEPQCVVVVNPDCRKCGAGFRHNIWGRMRIPLAQLETVWMTTRSDGTTTTRAAVLLREREDNQEGQEPTEI